MHHLSPVRTLLLLITIVVLAAACRAEDEAAEDPADDVVDDPAAEEPAEDDGDDAAEDLEDADEVDEDAVADVEFDEPGVSPEPCPDAVNEDNGCLYLGVLSDLTEGPFSAAGPVIQQAQEAFFQRVNEQGGVGGYDIDISTYVRDNLYQPEQQAQVWDEIRDDVLALGMSLGSAPTLAIMDDLEDNDVVTVPATWNSDWPFQEVIAETGTNYCFESMNSVDYYLQEENPDAESVMVVYFPQDFGQDGAAAIELAAEANDLEFFGVETPEGADNQGEAIGRIMAEDPDMVMIYAGPEETAALVGESAAQGYEGRFIGATPTWNVALLDTAAADALSELYINQSYWPVFGADTPGHEAMREALGDPERGSDFSTAGWTHSYPMLEALEAVAESDEDFSRSAVMEAFQSLEEVDYEGMLPEGAGNYAAEPQERALRESNFNVPDPDEPSGLAPVEEFFVGDTAAEHDFDQPCIDFYE